VNTEKNSVCVTDFLSVDISDGTVIKCTCELCVELVNKSNPKPRRESLIHVTGLFSKRNWVIW
jgi:hypothetical protein